MFKYTFRAVFTDGHVINQISEEHGDASTIVPPDGHGNRPSSFHDVLNYHGELETFSLSSDSEPDKVVVKLNSGEIFVNGQLCRIDRTFPPGIKREIVYCRAMNIEVIDGVSSQPTVSAFIVGWKTKLEDGSEIIFPVSVT